MGDVGSIVVHSTVHALQEVDQTEGETLYTDDTEGVRFTFGEETEFADFTLEDIISMVDEGLEVFREQLIDTLLEMRDAFIEEGEMADMYVMLEEQEPDWTA